MTATTITPDQLDAHAAEVPELIAMTGQLSVKAAAGEQSVPSFSMVAYSGGTMRIAGFTHPVVVDLQGIAIGRQTLPARLDHNPRQGVGHTTRVVVEDGRLLAEGLISRDTSWARDVARSGKNGFPWQASIGAQVLEAEFVPEGRAVEVNGRRFDGPVHVVRRAVLKEISFVDSGADSDTSAQVAATAARQMEETHMTFEQWLDARGFQVEDLGEAQRQTLEAAYRAEQSDQDLPDGGQTGKENDGQGQGQSDDHEDVTEAQAQAEPTPQTVHPAEVDPDGGDADGRRPGPSELTASDAPQADPVDLFRRRLAEETRRVEAIRRLCAGRHPEIEARAIERGWNESTTELHVLRASRPQVPAVVTPQRPESPRVYEAVALMASGLSSQRLETHYNEPVLEAADRLRGVGIQEFCELASGRRLPRFRRDATGWLEAAFSTTSLPGILSNIANKMLLEGYTYVEDSWRRICRIASVNDFKEHLRYRLTGAFTFEQVGADGELKHGRLGEQTFSQKADTHGIMFALTRQMIINDDMGAFTDIPRNIGMGAAEAIADAVWTRWLGNPLQSDGTPFFHADRGNYAAGAETALTVDGLTAAEVLFGQQTKPGGRPLGVSPAILLVPTALKVAAEMLMKSTHLNETTPEGTPQPSANPHVGKFQLVSSTYLSNSSFTGASSSAWYLLADPNRLPAMEVAFLNGVDRPTVEKTDADFNTLGIQFRGYIDFGVREQDHRGVLKMLGEADD